MKSSMVAFSDITRVSAARCKPFYLQPIPHPSDTNFTRGYRKVPGLRSNEIQEDQLRFYSTYFPHKFTYLWWWSFRFF